MKTPLLPVLALTLATSTLTGQLVFQDTFNSPNNANINADIASSGRQSGSNAGDYSRATPTRVSIFNNQLQVGDGTNTTLAFNTADLTSGLPLAAGFEFWYAADITMLSTTGWTSMTFINSEDTGRATTDLSLFLSGDSTGNLNPGSGNVTPTALTTALGQTWNPNTSHNYRYDVTMSSATAGSYNFSIDGTTIVSSHNFTLGSSSGLRLNFIGAGATQAGFDNLTVAVPEPSSFALLAGIASLGCIARRRRRR